MSMETRRLEFANALSTVADVTGYDIRPDVLSEGDAWPLLGRPAARHRSGSSYEITWLIRVVAPQDERAAVRWWDLRWPHLWEAIHPIAFVDGFDPVLLDASGGPGLFAYEITCRAEE